MTLKRFYFLRDGLNAHDGILFLHWKMKTKRIERKYLFISLKNKSKRRLFYILSYFNFPITLPINSIQNVLKIMIII